VDARASKGKSTESATKSILRRFGSHRNYKLHEKYGIDESEFDRLLAEQGGLCAICRSQVGKQVDHDHQTGAVRGILCLNCNAAMGAFHDNPAEIRAAIAYLEAHGC
jgi:hypothetical protein